MPTLNTNLTIEELRATELTYNESLRKLLRAFNNNPTNNQYLLKMSRIIRELNQDSAYLMVIFNRLSPIKKETAKRHFLWNLFNQTSNAPMETVLEFQLVEFGQFLQHYRTYSQLYVLYQHERLKDPDSFKQLDIWLRANTPKKAQGLGDHLSMPFQRGPRYILLLEKLIANPEQVDEELLAAFKGISQQCTEELKKINDELPNYEKEYKEQYQKLEQCYTNLEQHNKSKPSREGNELLSALKLVMEEIRNNTEELSDISRIDLLQQTFDLLTANKTDDYRETASMLPGHAMSRKQTIGLGAAMLLLASAVAAASIFLASAPLTFSVLGGAAVGAVFISGTITFFCSRHQSGVAKKANQLADKYEAYTMLDSSNTSS